MEVKSALYIRRLHFSALLCRCLDCRAVQRTELSLLFSCWRRVEKPRVTGRDRTGQGLGCWDNAAGRPDVEKPTELFCCLRDEVKPITYIIFIIIFNTVHLYFCKVVNTFFYHFIRYTIHIIFSAFNIYFCCELNHYIV